MAVLPMVQRIRVYPNDMARDAARRASGCCVQAITDTTFDNIFDALVVPDGRPLLSPLQMYFLVKELMMQRVELAHVATRPSWVQGGVRLLQEMRQAGVMAQQLKGDMPGSLKPWAQLLDQYEKTLAKRCLVDTGAQWRHAVDAVAKGWLPVALAQLGTVEVLGVGDILGPRLDLLNAFASVGIDVSIQMPFDANRPNAFGWPEVSLAAIEERGHGHIEVVCDHRIGVGPLHELRASVFGNTTVKQHDPHDTRAMALLFQHGAEQCRWVAQQVGAWLAEGATPADICIVHANPKDSGRDLYHALQAVQIPVRTAPSMPLKRSKAWRTLLLALDVVTGGFCIDDFVELWRLIGLKVQTTSGTWSQQRVIDLLQNAGVLNVATGNYRDALLNYAKTKAMHRSRQPSGEDIECIVKAIDDCTKQLLLLTQSGDCAQQLGVWSAWIISQVVPFLEVSSPPQAGVGAQTIMVADAIEMAACGRLLDLCDETRDAYGQSRVSLPLRLDVAELRATLGVWASGIQIKTGTIPTLGIAVVAPRDIGGCTFKHVVVCGADSGAFPATCGGDVLGEEARQWINRHLGMRLVQSGPSSGRGALDPEARDTWLFLEAMAAAKDSFFCTFVVDPGADSDGASTVVNELCRALGSGPITPSPTYTDSKAAGVTSAIEQWSFGTQTGGAQVNAYAIASGPQRFHNIEKRWPQVTKDLARRVLDTSNKARGLTTKMGVRATQVLHRYYQRGAQSVSSLDRLALCGYLHFAQDILGIAAQESHRLGADYRDQGVAAHGALEIVYRDLAKQGGLGVVRQDTHAALSRAYNIVMSSAHDILAEVHVHPLLQGALLEQAWEAVRVQMTIDLKSKHDLEPTFFEYTFDDRPHASAPVLRMASPDATCHIDIRGSIDRIDVSPTALRVIDYKRTVKSRIPLRHLQLPIYVVAAAENLEGNDLHLSSAWRPLHGGKCTEGVLDDTAEATDITLLREQLSTALWARVNRCRVDGDISPDPAPASTCERCDYQPLCRFEPQNPS